MDQEEMYFVIAGNAITLDETDTAVICGMNQDGTVNWDSFDLIDWLDLLPEQYQLYKAVVDFLQTYSSPMYVK